VVNAGHLQHHEANVRRKQKTADIAKTRVDQLQASLELARAQSNDASVALESATKELEDTKRQLSIQLPEIASLPSQAAQRAVRVECILTQLKASKSLQADQLSIALEAISKEALLMVEDEAMRLALQEGRPITITALPEEEEYLDPETCMDIGDFIPQVGGQIREEVPVRQQES
jgi:hypothetical protein